jgi:hypothetical protein
LNTGNIISTARQIKPCGYRRWTFSVEIGWHNRSQAWGGAYQRAYLQAYLRKANRRPDFLPP